MSKLTQLGDVRRCTQGTFWVGSINDGVKCQSPASGLWVWLKTLPEPRPTAPPGETI